MSNFKERVVKNWQTTVIGVAILGYAFYGHLSSILTTSELGLMIVLGWVFLGAKKTILDGLALGLTNWFGGGKEGGH